MSDDDKARVEEFLRNNPVLRDDRYTAKWFRQHPKAIDDLKTVDMLVGLRTFNNELLRRREIRDKETWRFRLNPEAEWDFRNSHREEAPDGYAIVELNADATEFVFYPIRSIVFVIDKIVAVDIVDAQNCFEFDGETEELEEFRLMRVRRHPDGVIEFVNDISFAKSEEDEALAYAIAKYAWR
jgi:hypothetical protein